MTTTAATQSREYIHAAMTYAEAVHNFREAAVAEMRRHMPADVKSIVFRLNETPRLVVCRVIFEPDTMTDEWFMGTPEGLAIDEIAAELGVATKDEADALLNEYRDALPWRSEWVLHREVG